MAINAKIPSAVTPDTQLEVSLAEFDYIYHADPRLCLDITNLAGSAFISLNLEGAEQLARCLIEFIRNHPDTRVARKAALVKSLLAGGFLGLEDAMDDYVSIRRASEDTDPWGTP